MKEVTIKIEAKEGINVNTCKATEVEILTAIQKRFAGTGTYLSGLFSENLTRWFECQVKNDFTGDIWDIVDGYQDEVARKSTEISELKSALANQSRVFADEKSDLDYKVRRLQGELVSTRESLENRVKYLLEMNRKYQDEIRELASQDCLTAV